MLPVLMRSARRPPGYVSGEDVPTRPPDPSTSRPPMPPSTAPRLRPRQGPMRPVGRMGPISLRRRVVVP